MRVGLSGVQELVSCRSLLYKRVWLLVVPYCCFLSCPYCPCSTAFLQHADVKQLRQVTAGVATISNDLPTAQNCLYTTQVMDDWHKNSFHCCLYLICIPCHHHLYFYSNISWIASLHNFVYLFIVTSSAYPFHTVLPHEEYYIIYLCEYGSYSALSPLIWVGTPHTKSIECIGFVIMVICKSLSWLSVLLISVLHKWKKY